ncbi:MAG TPA: LysR family transcriptional regulator [Bradyrhizobium sp.]|nr:LysR family transcriptional regulator [Bradyrhizobium sp.]
MHRRHQHLNIPIEIVRTVVAISETGSLSKAAERLGLSQPAVSSQVKRLQSLVGGSLFVKTANGTTTTELGKLALQQARRILEANDQLLRLGGNNDASQAVRLGLSTLFVNAFIKGLSAESLADIFVQADHSTPIGRGLVDGYIDIACIYETRAIEPEVHQMVVNEYSDPLLWVRSKDFVLSPGAPIPIVTWPADDWMISTLTRHGLTFKIVFNAADFHTRLTAVNAGIGFTAVPESLVPADLVKAREYYLPALPPAKALLCVRSGVENEKASGLIRHLSEKFFKRPKSQGRGVS